MNSSAVLLNRVDAEYVLAARAALISPAAPLNSLMLVLNKWHCGAEYQNGGGALKTIINGSRRKSRQIKDLEKFFRNNTKAYPKAKSTAKVFSKKVHFASSYEILVTYRRLFVVTFLGNNVTLKHSQRGFHVEL